MQRRLRQACTAIREQTAVGYAKIATIGGFCDLELIVVKATSPDDAPLPERYVHQLVKIFAFSPAASHAFSLAFTRRFGRTRTWRVALKCLALLHRLLHSLPDSNRFRSDLLWARSNGLLSLHPCHFRDTSSASSSHEFTGFIRSYARLLDEALDCFSFEDKDGPPPPASLSDASREMGRILELLPQLQSLIDRVMDCTPTGAARRSFIVKSAMKQIVRDSFACYETSRRDMAVLLDNLFQMQYRNSVSALQIYNKAAQQSGQLSEFYESCRLIGLCGAYEYPLVDKIPTIHVQAMESFLHDRWQLTESSSSDSTSPSTSESLPSMATDDTGDRQLARLETVIRTEWEKFDEEDEPSWEVLLESWASVYRAPTTYGYRYEYEYAYRYGSLVNMMEEPTKETDGWKVHAYSPSPNPNPNPNPNPYNTYIYGNQELQSYQSLYTSMYTGGMVSPNHMQLYQPPYPCPPYVFSPSYTPYPYEVQSPYWYSSSLI